MHLYIHIPFCKQRCSYCDFYFSVNRRHEPAFFRALFREIRQRAGEIRRLGTLETLYLGGGTPSLARETHLEQLFGLLREHFTLSARPEITLEANPDDISAEKLDFWKSLGINRLSLGVQSFRERDLQVLGRGHTATQTDRALELIRRAAFRNVTLDLIYGLPGMDLQQWEHQIDRFLTTGFPHLSAYALTVEQGTLLWAQVRKGRIHIPADRSYEAQFHLLRRKMQDAGWEHYEISNFALPGFVSRHNSAYWEGKAYVGLGPSAHSFDGHRLRRWNVANLFRYIKALDHGTRYWEQEELSGKERFNEILMTRLRTVRGLNDENLRLNFPDLYPAFEQRARTYLSEGLMHFRDGYWRLSPEALFRADGLIAEFFEVD